MLKKNIELIRDTKRQALLTWHKPDGEGGTIPIAFEFSDDIDAEMAQRVQEVCQRPINVIEDGKSRKLFTGSSAHFLALPKALSRLGFRARLF